MAYATLNDDGTIEKYPLSMTQLRRERPNTSFPTIENDESFFFVNTAIVHSTERPDGDVITEGWPERRDDNLFYQTWEVREFSQDELEMRRQWRLDELRMTHDEYDRASTEFEGVQVRTGLEARVNALGILKSIEISPEVVTFPFDWNGVDGEVSITSAEHLQSLFLTVIGCLSKGFEVKSAIRDEIRGLEGRDMLDYDVQSQWDALIAS